MKQVCFPVGCILPACCLYLLACTAPGWCLPGVVVSSWGGVFLGGVSSSGGCFPGGTDDGTEPPFETSSWVGVCLPGGPSWCLPGGCVSKHALRQTESQTHKNINLPQLHCEQ